jgi:hypothetical protein
VQRARARQAVTSQGRNGCALSRRVQHQPIPPRRAQVVAEIMIALLQYSSTRRSCRQRNTQHVHSTEALGKERLLTRISTVMRKFGLVLLRLRRKFTVLRVIPLPVTLTLPMVEPETALSSAIVDRNFAIPTSPLATAAATHRGLPRAVPVWSVVVRWWWYVHRPAAICRPICTWTCRCASPSPAGHGAKSMCSTCAYEVTRSCGRQRRPSSSSSRGTFAAHVCPKKTNAPQPIRWLRRQPGKSRTPSHLQHGVTLVWCCQAPAAPVQSPLPPF